MVWGYFAASGPGQRVILVRKLVRKMNSQEWPSQILDLNPSVHSVPMMKITGLSHIFKWENLHNWWLT
jgi:hypothetical protein